MNKKNPFLIKGNVHIDERGKIAFVNSFDMTKVKRTYRIEPKNNEIIRAWQGHQIESKWFSCVQGSFEICLIKVHNWLDPSKELPIIRFELTEETSNVLFVPGGYVNGFYSKTLGSKLMVYSDRTLEDSKEDDFRFDKSYWNINDTNE